MRISFYGACREVTGSNILLETQNKKVLLECGFFQGYKLSEERNYTPFNYDPKKCDFLIIGHAHLDHTGRIPKLVKEGFRGKIFSTSPTKELARIVLEDSQKLMEEEAKRDNHIPLYSKNEIDKAMKLFVAIPYNEKVKISEGITLTFKNAGHILGSAITLIESENKKLVYTSDLGNTPSYLLDPPEIILNADILICESTYGGRIHEDFTQRREKLAQIINTTVARNGVLMIPSFAIERTQELLHDIEHFCSSYGCKKPIFFLDSPLAEKVTRIFRKYPAFLSAKLRGKHKDHDFFGLERIKFTTTVEQSKEIDSFPNPKIIIAGSGMMNGGRIIFHLEKYLVSSKNALLIVGYQSHGTLGRKILNGEREITLFGKKIPVNAQIKAIGSYSAHADLPQIMDWLRRINNLKQIFVVHGENDQGSILAEKIKDNLGLEAVLPKFGESYNV